MDKILSVRKNSQVFSLFLKIQEYQKSANRTEIVNAAIERAMTDRENGTLNWHAVSTGRISTMHIENDAFPDFIQLRVDDDKYRKIVKQMREDFKLDKDSPAPFVVKLLLMNYLFFLESNGVEIIKNTAHDDADKRKKEEISKFRQLASTNEKLEAIYELLLEIKYER